MLWFNFILGLNFIFLCFWVWYCMIMSLKQKKIKFKPRIKLNQQHILVKLGTISLALCPNPNNQSEFGQNMHEITPFAVHYEKIFIHLRETATNSAKIHSLARQSEHLHINQIQ